MNSLLQIIDNICTNLNQNDKMIKNGVTVAQSLDSRNVPCIIATRGSDTINFINITTSIGDLSDGIILGILSIIAKWKPNTQIKDVDISRMLMECAIDHIFNTATLDGTIPKHTSNKIVKQLLSAFDANPNNRNHILQGFQFWLSYKFKSITYKDKHFPTHYFKYAYWNNNKRATEDKDISVWALAKFQGFENANSIPSKVITDDRSFKTILSPLAKANNVDPLSVLYTTMLVLKFSPPQNIIDQVNRKTKAPKAMLEGLDASSLFASWE